MKLHCNKSCLEHLPDSSLVLTPDVYDPWIPLQHYLSYLNSLRVFEYCGAIDSLFHYFDRQMSLGDAAGGAAPSGSNAAQKPKTDDDATNRSYRYAALSLCAAHFRFGHR